MECPHCHQAIETPEGEEITLVECQACGSQSMPDAEYCHKCGKGLGGEADEEDMQVCAACGKTGQPFDNYCAGCGQSFNPEDEPDDEDDEDDDMAPAAAAAPGKRKACSDGMCIGIIGPDGKCTICGKPYEGPQE
jgi:DNA-directed RNA polymerase subunit RPC12/RpoP